MSYIIYGLAGVSIVLAIGGLVEFFKTKHVGLLLSSIVSFAFSGLAIYLIEWWPLVVGFAANWGLRLLGLDPGYQKNAEMRTDEVNDDFTDSLTAMKSNDSSNKSNDTTRKTQLQRYVSQLLQSLDYQDKMLIIHGIFLGDVELKELCKDFPYNTRPHDMEIVKESAWNEYYHSLIMPDTSMKKILSGMTSSDVEWLMKSMQSNAHPVRIGNMHAPLLAVTLPETLSYLIYWEAYSIRKEEALADVMNYLSRLVKNEAVDGSLFQKLESRGFTMDLIL